MTSTTMTADRGAVDSILTAAEREVEATLSRIELGELDEVAKRELSRGSAIRFFSAEARQSARNTGCY